MAGDTQFLIKGKNMRHFFFVLSGQCVGQPIAKMDSLALMVQPYNASINPYKFLEDGYHAGLYKLLPSSSATSTFKKKKRHPLPTDLYFIMIIINNTKYSCVSCIKVKICYSARIAVSTPDYIV
jgi:hypothetical protein